MNTFTPIQIIPTMSTIIVNNKTINTLIVDIPKEEYLIVENLYMWCSSKPGNYGRGIANTDNDPKKVERTGKLGEIALAKIFKLPVDIEYKTHGDKTDRKSVV